MCRQQQSADQPRAATAGSFADEQVGRQNSERPEYAIEMHRKGVWVADQRREKQLQQRIYDRVSSDRALRELDIDLLNRVQRQKLAYQQSDAERNQADPVIDVCIPVSEQPGRAEPEEGNQHEDTDGNDGVLIDRSAARQSVEDDDAGDGDHTADSEGDDVDRRPTIGPRPPDVQHEPPDDGHYRRQQHDRDDRRDQPCRSTRGHRRPANILFARPGARDENLYEIRLRRAFDDANAEIGRFGHRTARRPAVTQLYRHGASVARVVRANGVVDISAGELTTAGQRDAAAHNVGDQLLLPGQDDRMAPPVSRPDRAEGDDCTEKYQIADATEPRGVTTHRCSAERPNGIRYCLIPP